MSAISTCLHCVSTRVVEAAVDTLSIDHMLQLLDLLTACFPFKKLELEDLRGFDGIVMLQGAREYKSLLGFVRQTWEPLAMMSVKQVQPEAEGFVAANAAFNITNVCVRKDLQGQGLGSKMIQWYLNSMTPGSVAFLHVDKVPAKMQETEDEKAWREFVLQRVPHQDMTQEAFAPDTLSMDTEKEGWWGLVAWYKSMGFTEHSSNDIEVCLSHYAHMDAVDYDSDDWKSVSSEFSEQSVCVPDQKYTDDC